MDELLAKRGRVKVQLEKVLRRIEEFPYFSELDMIQEVGVCLACVLCYINRTGCLATLSLVSSMSI